MLTARVHQFPKPLDKCRAWLRALGPRYDDRGRALPLAQQYHRIVCEHHFEPFDYAMQNLKRSAIPSIFESEPSEQEPEAFSTEDQPEEEEESSHIAGDDYELQAHQEPSEQEPETFSTEDQPEEEEEKSHIVRVDYELQAHQVPELRALARPAGTGCTFPETNTFTLDPEVLADMHDLSDKIQNVYSTLLGKSFTVACRGVDDTNSEYVFSSSSDTRRAGEKHDGLNCCECRAGITGYRYKCVSCPDYDLCGACEALGAHSQHVVMRLSRPLKSRKARVFMRSICEAMKSAGISTLNDMLDGPAESSPQASGNTAQALSASADLTGHSKPDDLQASFQVVNHRPFVVKEEPMDEDETKTLSTPNSNTTTAEFKENQSHVPKCQNVDVAKRRTKIIKVVKKKETSDEGCKRDPLKNYYETFGETNKVQKLVPIIPRINILKQTQKGILSSRPTTFLMIQPQSVQRAATVSQNSLVMGQNSPVMGQSETDRSLSGAAISPSGSSASQMESIMDQSDPLEIQNVTIDYMSNFDELN